MPTGPAWEGRLYPRGRWASDGRRVAAGVVAIRGRAGKSTRAAQSIGGRAPLSAAGSLHLLGVPDRPAVTRGSSSLLVQPRKTRRRDAPEGARNARRAPSRAPVGIRL